MKRKRTKKPIIPAFRYDGRWQLTSSIYHQPEPTPFIHTAQVEAGSPCSLSVQFSVGGPAPFWSRQRLALRYWWLIASGRLEYAVLAKVK
jgi:hypothetical protein